MKKSVLALVVVGVVAATCAAMLVMYLRGSHGVARTPASTTDLQAKIVVAAKALPAMTIVDGASVTVKSILRKDVPANCINEPTYVVGKVLTVPMVAGQAFTPSHFATKKTGVRLAAALPPGMRAVSLSLTDEEGLLGLLYPGSVVDVVASLKIPAEDGQREQHMSITLVQSVQVLAIERETIASGDDETAQPQAQQPPAQRAVNGQHTVTLMVTPRQAEAIQLALVNGSIALSMRNPLDSAIVSRGSTFLSDLSEAVASRLTKVSQQMQRSLPSRVARNTEGSASQPASNSQAVTAPPSRWQMAIIRGGQWEVRSFPLSAGTPAILVDGSRRP